MASTTLMEPAGNGHAATQATEPPTAATAADRLDSLQEIADTHPLRPRGVHPMALHAVTYFVTTAAFLFGVNMPSVAHLRYHFLGNLLPTSAQSGCEATVLILIATWGLHFVRLFGEALFIHSYRRRMTPFGAMITSLFYVMFGTWLGWSINFYLRYRTPAIWIVMAGVALYLVGEIGCIVCRVKAAMLKRKHRCSSLELHTLPSGVLFRYVSCPQHTFDIVAHLGMMLATFTMASIVFVCICIICIVVAAYKRHKAYCENVDVSSCDNDIGVGRKALIPFVF